LIEPIERIAARGGPRNGDDARHWFVEVLERGVVTTLEQVATALELGNGDELALFAPHDPSDHDDATASDNGPTFVASADFQHLLHGMRKVALVATALHEVQAPSEFS
jgi:hypothetical protein